MEKQEVAANYRLAAAVMVLGLVGGISLALGLFWSKANAAESDHRSKKTKVVYPKKTQLDFEGTQIEGELKRPHEFYFQHRPQEQLDSLVKKRKNFHREMLRDVVFSK